MDKLLINFIIEKFEYFYEFLVKAMDEYQDELYSFYIKNSINFSQLTKSILKSLNELRSFKDEFEENFFLENEEELKSKFIDLLNKCQEFNEKSYNDLQDQINKNISENEKVIFAKFKRRCIEFLNTINIILLSFEKQEEQNWRSIETIPEDYYAAFLRIKQLSKFADHAKPRKSYFARKNYDYGEGFYFGNMAEKEPYDKWKKKKRKFKIAALKEKSNV